MGGLFKAANMDDEECATLGIEAISEVVHIGYEHLADYIQDIGNLTYNLINANKHRQACGILYFW